MERLSAALSSRIAQGLTADERDALRSALAHAAEEIQRLEQELHALSQRGGASE